MNRLFCLWLLCSPIYLLAQNSPSFTYEIPDNPTFFDFVKFHITEEPTDTAEGSFMAKVKKMNQIWEPRLYPTGNAQISGAAITNYAKYFNQNGNTDDTSHNWSAIQQKTLQ